jgi:hypothetical protein
VELRWWGGYKLRVGRSVTRALNGVKFKYGADSSEYEMVGGTRQSERKKPVRKAKLTA